MTTANPQTVTVARATIGYDTCGAPKRQAPGGPCTRPAGWGTDHAGVGSCKLHGGSTLSHRRSAALITARQRLTELTARPLTPAEFRDPMRGLWEHYTEACLNVDFLRDKVMELTEWTGDIFSLDRDGEKHATSEEARAYVRLYKEAQIERRKSAEACIKAGIMDRMASVEEGKWLLMAELVRRSLIRYGMPDKDRQEVERIISAEVRLLATSEG